MQYVRSISGSVSKTWNSINPATLSGAIDVIVVEREDGTLACSPFHVRFGKFSLLRPYEKKVEFRVNDVKQDYSMKLGEGGEAFFVFETSADVPEALQTSPIMSPASSPQPQLESPSAMPAVSEEPEPFDLNASPSRRPSELSPVNSLQRPPVMPIAIPGAGHSMTETDFTKLSQSYPERDLHQTLLNSPTASETSLDGRPQDLATSMSAREARGQTEPPIDLIKLAASRSGSPPRLTKEDAKTRALNLSKKLLNSKIPSHVTDEGDLMLDMTGYKSSEEDALKAELVARQILAEELEGNYDIGSLIGADENGHLWIYSSEEAKETAMRKNSLATMNVAAISSTDALSDPGYQSDDGASQTNADLRMAHHERRESDSAVSVSTLPESPVQRPTIDTRTYAKTLRLTSDQLKNLNLKPGSNPVSFTVNRATCTASMYLWKQNVPIVVSDVDGTITKSDALGHVLNMIGRDWTHPGVAKLYSDIVANGYNIMYLTSRSVGQADTTRTYLHGIVQEGYKLPKGPVILSPDRTLAALRREVYLRKPEVFKMACLRDIMSLFPQRQYPFYSGFGNRLTDALSYRSVNIPSTRIFTINSTGEVVLDLLTLNRYRTAYTTMRETIDHFFPPVAMLVHEGGEAYTDFNYWRERPLEIDEISLTDSEEDELDQRSTYEGTDAGDDDVFSEELNESYLSRDSIDDPLAQVVRRSIEQDDGPESVRVTYEQEDQYDDETDEDDDYDPDEMDLIAEAAGRQNRKPISRTVSEDETISTGGRRRSVAVRS